MTNKTIEALVDEFWPGKQDDFRYSMFTKEQLIELVKKILENYK